MSSKNEISLSQLKNNQNSRTLNLESNSNANELSSCGGAGPSLVAEFNMRDSATALRKSEETLHGSVGRGRTSTRAEKHQPLKMISRQTTPIDTETSPSFYNYQSS